MVKSAPLRRTIKKAELPLPSTFYLLNRLHLCGTLISVGWAPSDLSDSPSMNERNIQAISSCCSIKPVKVSRTLIVELFTACIHVFAEIADNQLMIIHQLRHHLCR